MSPDICLLITMMYNGSLSRVAVKSSSELLRNNYQYWCEPDVKLLLANALLPHCRLGPIVEVEEIFDICVNENESTNS